MRRTAITNVIFLAGLLFATISLTLNITSITLCDWSVFQTGISVVRTNYTQYHRVRSLWSECITENHQYNDYVKDTCYPLEPYDGNAYSNKAGLFIITARVAHVVLALFVALASLGMLAGLIAFRVLVYRRIYCFTSLLRNRITAGAGLILWINGFLLYVSLIIYFDTLRRESFLYDGSMASPRSSWSQALRIKTIYTQGTAVPATFVSCVTLYLSSFLILASVICEI